MTLVFAILATALILWWLIAKELPIAYGALAATRAIPRRAFLALVVVTMAVAMFLPWTSYFGERLASGYGMVSIGELSVVGLAVFSTLIIFERFGVMPSLCAALLGALEAYRILGEGATRPDYALMAGWLVAPLVVALLAAVLYYIYRVTLGRSHIHFIRLSGYLRDFVVVGVIFVAFAVAVNNGSLLIMLGRLLMGPQVVTVLVPTVMLIVAVVLFWRAVVLRMDIAAERYFDMSSQALVVVSYSVAITLILFSSSAVRAVGLEPTPLSLTQLVVAAMVGIRVVHRAQVNVESSVLGRNALGVVLAPFVSFLLYRLFSGLFAGYWVTDHNTNLTILMCTLMLVMLVFFARYIRRQERIRNSSRRLILSQQQQLYENQKALNAMEIKSILSENESLHGMLELKRKEIINVALGISEQKEFLEMVTEKVRRAAKSSGEEKDRLIAEVEQDLSQRTSFSGEIDEFYTQAEILHKDFSLKLTEEFPHLTTSERRLATLLRLGFSSKYIATLMNISPKSVEVGRYRLRQKLGLQKGDNLISFIKSI